MVMSPRLRMARLLLPRGLPADVWRSRTYQELAGTLDSTGGLLAVALILTSVLVVWRKRAQDLSTAAIGLRLVILSCALLPRLVRRKWPGTYYANRHLFQLLFRFVGLLNVAHFAVRAQRAASAPPDVQRSIIQAYSYSSTRVVNAPPDVQRSIIQADSCPSTPRVLPTPASPATPPSLACSTTLPPALPFHDASEPPKAPADPPDLPRAWAPLHRLPAAFAFLLTFSGCIHCLGPVAVCPLPIVPQLLFTALNMFTVVSFSSQLAILAVELSPYGRDLQVACLGINSLIAQLAFFQTGVAMGSPALDLVCDLDSPATMVAFVQLYFVVVLPLYCSYRLEQMFRHHVAPEQVQQAAPEWLADFGAGGCLLSPACVAWLLKDGTILLLLAIICWLAAFAFRVLLPRPAVR